MTNREANEAVASILDKAESDDIFMSTYRACGLGYITHDEAMRVNLVSLQMTMGRTTKPADKRAAMATFRKILEHRDWTLVFERPVLGLLNSINWQDDRNIERRPSAVEKLRK